MRGAARLSGAGTPFDWWLASGYSRAPYASVVTGASHLTAGTAGLALGIFGWVDLDTGVVSSTAFTSTPVLDSSGNPVLDSSGNSVVSNQLDPTLLLGFVVPVVPHPHPWQREYVLRPVDGVPPFPLRILRSGFGCVVAAQGEFDARFPDGGEAGQQVFADPATGLPYAGDPGGFVPTRWTLMRSGGAGEALRISSFVRPLN